MNKDLKILRQLDKGSFTQNIVAAKAKKFKEKRQTSKEIFAFASAFARCELALKLISKKTQTLYYWNKSIYSAFSITRNTWASPGLNMPWPVGNYTLKTKMVFVLGDIENSTLQTQIQQEAMQYRDILQGTL